MFINNFMVMQATTSVIQINQRRARMGSAGTGVSVASETSKEVKEIVSVPRLEGESVRQYLKRTFTG